jgi:hypothetical protein
MHTNTTIQRGAHKYLVHVCTATTYQPHMHEHITEKKRIAREEKITKGT